MLIVVLDVCACDVRAARRATSPTRKNSELLTRLGSLGLRLSLYLSLSPSFSLHLIPSPFFLHRIPPLPLSLPSPGAEAASRAPPAAAPALVGKLSVKKNGCKSNNSGSLYILGSWAL